MERYFKPKLSDEIGTGLRVGASSSASASVQQSLPVTSAAKKYVDLNSLPSDPAERKKIFEYNPNQIDEIRRAYLLKGPCQPRGHDFPQKLMGAKLRRFNPDWFDQYANWLEYSMKEDKAYCLCCYLFRDQINNKGGGEAFVSEGFCAWNKKERLDVHVGAVNSAHNMSLKKCEDLMRQKQSIVVALHKQSDIVRNEYQIRLRASIDACRFLLHQGLAFRGHDESEDSLNKGNFLEMIKYTADQNESVRKVVLGNAIKNKNCQMISPHIQRDIVHCFAQEIVRNLIEEFKDDFFSLMVDESSDVSGKEQMAVVLRFVDSYGNVKERFICVVHVMETSALSLKSAIDNVFADFGLSLMKIRGQGYDGASNMKGEFSGLKTLIMNENQSAYYVHCFAHQLQLALVAVARKNLDIADFFNMISTLINVVGASCKRKDMIRQKQAEKVAQGIYNGEFETGKGLNQELSLKRAVDTRWGSHYKSLLNLVALFSSVLEVLEVVSCDATDSSKKAQAVGLLGYLQSFDFVFNLQLMLTILAFTHELSLALQRKDTDILNAMALVKVTRERLLMARNDGWGSLLGKITAFCNENEIDCVDMNDEYVNRHRPRRKTNITNDFHYRVECFNAIMDQQILEINDRFNEVNSELLLCVASLNPSYGFADFNIAKLVRLSQFYPDDFSQLERLILANQLETYIMDVRSDDRFSQLEGLTDLSTLLVQTRKHLSYPLVNRLLKLALILPVATASVERCFSAMNIVKTDLRNRIGDQFLNDCLVCFIEKDLLMRVTNDDVIKRFQSMKTRKGQL